MTVPNHETTVIFKDHQSLEFAAFSCDARPGSRERVQPLPLNGGLVDCKFCPERVGLTLIRDGGGGLRKVKIVTQACSAAGAIVTVCPRP